jgi:hypothetical protein
MATIERESIRASISLGNIEISTPDVVSFNVRKSRGQKAATFSASVKMDAAVMSDNSLSLIDKGVVIEAGVKGSEKRIFTGVVQKVTVNPIRTDASKVMVSLAGKDGMSVMEGQKINRRVKTYRDGDTPPERWGVVTAIEEDNTPVKTGFGFKTFSKKKTVVLSVDKLSGTITPAAYADVELIREAFGVPLGSIKAEKIND